MGSGRMMGDEYGRGEARSFKASCIHDGSFYVIPLFK